MPGLCHFVVSLDKKLYSTLSLFSQVYKWVPAIMLGGNFAMDMYKHPNQGGVVIFLVALCYENWVKIWPDGPLNNNNNNNNKNLYKERPLSRVVF